MKFLCIYNQKGKQVFPRAGLIIPAGSQVLLKDKTWISLDADHVCKRERVLYDNLSQSHDGGDFYLDLK